MPCCTKCKSKDAGSVCSGCDVTHYCSTECQRLDWQDHKTICQLIKTNRSDSYAYSNEPDLLGKECVRRASINLPLVLEETYQASRRTQIEDMNATERNHLRDTGGKWLYEDWGYRFNEGGDFEQRLHKEDSDIYYAVTPYSDPLFRVLQQTFWQDRPTSIFEIKNLYGRQYDLQTDWRTARPTRMKVRRFLGEFLVSHRLQRVQAVAEYPLDEDTTVNMASAVVASRLLLLLFDGCFSDAFTLGRLFEAKLQEIADM